MSPSTGLAARIGPNVANDASGQGRSREAMPSQRSTHRRETRKRLSEVDDRFCFCELFATLHASPLLALTWSSAMSDPKAEKRRAEAERARRLAALPADQDRLKQYAEELERKAQREDAGHAKTRPEKQKQPR